MILKSLHLENFKGAKDKIYKFGKTTRVSGIGFPFNRGAGA